MEIVGISAITTERKSGKAVTRSGDGSFVEHFQKNFKTVAVKDVPHIYAPAGSSLKKKDEVHTDFRKETEDEESLGALLREYKRIILKLYRYKHLLIGGCA